MNAQKTRQRYTPEFKDDALGLVVKQGYNCAEAARRLGINPNNIVRWVRQYRDQQEAVESDTVLSTIMCEIFLCHFLHKWQIGGDFTYGLRPPVNFHL